MASGGGSFMSPGEGGHLGSLVESKGGQDEFPAGHQQAFPAGRRVCLEW